jgi:tetratricopeptide (TPR) repeat protein
MGREIVYCNLCGVRILEEDLLKGRALTLLDKVFCSACKAKAFAQMKPESEEEPEQTLQPPPKALLDEAAAPETFEEPEPIEEEAPRPKAGRTRVAPPPRPMPVRQKKGSNLPIVVGGLIGFLATVALLVILLRKSDPAGRGGSGGGGHTSNGGGSNDPGPTPAAKALEELEKLASSKAGVDAILSKCTEIESVVRGTPQAERLAEIRRDAENERDKAARERTFNEVFERAKTEAAGDKGRYERYQEIMDLFSRAQEIAQRDVQAKVIEVNEARNSYSDPYEEEAMAIANEVTPRAHQLAQEKRFKDAVKVIDAQFPAKYKQSRAWKQIKAARDQYEIQGRNQGGSSSSPTDPTDWKGYFRRAQQAQASRDWRRARADYERGMRLLPPFSNLGSDERKAVAFAEYDHGCTYFLEAKSVSADAKKVALDKAFEWLGKAVTDGLGGMACNCHGSLATHLEKDEDLDGFRDDARYKDLQSKLKK